MPEYRPEDVNPAAAGDGPKVADGLEWRDCRDAAFTMNGLPWWHQEQRLCRLPCRAEGVVRAPIWQLAQEPSGARLRFRTDSPRLALRIEHAEMPIRVNLAPIGHSGIDLYVGPPTDSAYWASTKPDGVATAYESELFTDQPPEMREIALYLPTYNALTALAVGLEGDATIEAPSPFALDRPVVFYGTSITQGGCNSRPGTGFVAAVARALGIDFVNLGFSGNGMGEREIRELVAEIDTPLFVLDYDSNAGMEGLEHTLDAFHELLRGRRPHTPILVLSKPWRSAHLYSADIRDDTIARRAFIQQRVAAWRAAGDANVRFLDGLELIGPEDTESFVDGVHPNDLGFARMAERLAPTLRELLGL